MKNDLLLIQGNFYTPTSGESSIFFSCLLIQEGKIIASGCMSYLKDYYRNIDFSLIRTLKMPTKFIILPGFIDSHCHPIAGSLQKMNCVLQKKNNWKEALIYLMRFCEENPDYDWIFASGFEDSWFEDLKSLLPVDILDELPIEKPITITRFDGHAFWCNSLAIKQAGITFETANPTGGIIERNMETGRLTGLFHDEAMKLIRRVFPPLKSGIIQAAYEKACQKMLRKGITCFADASTKENYINAYLSSALNKSGHLKPQPVVYLSWKDFKVGDWSILSPKEKITILEQFREKAKNLGIEANTIKLFIDGVIESGSAALKSPYLLLNGSSGILHYKTEDLKEIISVSTKAGFKLHYHVVGDKAFEEITNMIHDETIANAVDSPQNNTNGVKNKKTFSKLNANNNAHTLAHVQLVDKADTLNKIQDFSLCFSPLWFYQDFCYPAMLKQLGHFRTFDLYPIGFFTNHPNRVGFGSDWPVSSINPMKGIEVAVTRLSPGAKQNSHLVCCPQHRITLEEALRFYTIGAAMIVGEEENRGSLEVGKHADLIVLDKDIFMIRREYFGCIHRTKVLLTMIKGEIVYKNDFFEEL